MEDNLKITFGGKSYFAQIDGNSEQIFSKKKLVESSVFNDLTDTDFASEMDEKEWQYWTTNLYDLFKEAVSVRIEYLELEI